MPTYGTHVGRTTSGSDPLVPEPLATAAAGSAEGTAAQHEPNRCARRNGCRVPTMPVAYWAKQNTGMKQTGKAWKNALHGEEPRALCRSRAYLDDADVPIWSEVQPRITEACGQLIDLAVLWGINKPVTWGESVFTGAGKSGHYIVQGTGVDLGQDVTRLGAALAQTGYTVNGFAAAPGTSWNLAGLRSAQGVPIYQPDMTDTPGGNLYGYQMSEINNGSWQTGLTGAVMLAGDLPGACRPARIRSRCAEGVADDTGKVILNLMQQDSVAMRMTMRLAYACVNPVTIMNPGAAITARWPFGAVLPVGATPPTGSAVREAAVRTLVCRWTAHAEPNLENEQDTPALEAQNEAAEELEKEARQAASEGGEHRAARQPASRRRPEEHRGQE